MDTFETVTLATGAFTKTWKTTPGQRYLMRWYNTGSPTAGTISAKELDGSNAYALMVGSTSAATAAVWNIATMVSGSAPFSGGIEFVASADECQLVGASLTDNGTYRVSLVPVRD